ncbi:glycerol-3-phosphate acyltransferase [bacterium]|nr:glycerol-3-phosphate acyltransferase [bacterium]
MKTAQMLALAILLGSIPFNRIVPAKAMRGMLVPTLNVIKGFIPVYLAVRSPDSYVLIALVGALAMLSHSFPYWLMFKYNGNAVGVSLGVLIGLNIPAGVFVLAIYGVSLLAFNRLSLAAIISGISAPVMLKVLGAPTAYIWFGIAGCAYMITSHANSITHLMDGTEPWFRTRG